MQSARRYHFDIERADGLFISRWPLRCVDEKRLILIFSKIVLFTVRLFDPISTVFIDLGVTSTLSCAEWYTSQTRIIQFKLPLLLQDIS